MAIAAALSSDLVHTPIAWPPTRRHWPCPKSKYFVSPVMKDESRIPSTDRKSKEEISKGSNRRSELPQTGYLSGSSDLRFDRLQPSDKEVNCKHKKVFGRYIAREAMLDEEFWTAAWLRAESHWEDMSDTRHVESFKRQFAEQEFHAIKRRCTRQFNGKSICIVVVKKGENSIKRTVLSSIVATLDINIQHLLWGEKYPGDYMWRPASIFGRKDQPLYGYVANLSVAKYARRQGIASNMLLLAMDVAKSHGAKEVFVHVHKDNVAAWKLYEKLGFKLIETIMAEQMHLMCLKTT